MDATATLFVEVPDLQIHHDPAVGSLYIAGSCQFRLYLFSDRNFAVPLHHPAFDPATPYFAVPLHVAHPPPAPPAPVVPVAHADPAPDSPPQVVPDIPLSSESDPLEATGSSSSSSSGPSMDYSPAGPGMANGYLTE